MKKAGLILIFVSAIFLNGYSQNVDDALRYSQIFYSGSARFMGMGGAFTALGGDLSAISLNPASTGVFRSFEFSISPQMYNFNSTAKWNGTSSSDFRYALNLSNIGFVANLGPKNDNFSLNFAYSFNKTNNFNENITISGISNNSSMADYWASQANGTYYKDLRGAAGIAYDAWLIDTVSNTGASTYATTFSAYGTSTGSTYGQTIKRVINNDGYTGEHSLSIGGNLSSKLYFGVTLGISQLRYTGHYQHIETTDPNAVPLPDLKNFVYTDHFEASGTGYSGQIGLIYKPLEFLRLGAALHTPTFYRVSENFYDNITSAYNNNDTYEFSNDKLSYKYSFTTPLRYNFGAAFQIKKFALLSIDYEHLDYSKTKFSSDSYDYSLENQDIQNILKAANNFRFGAEFRIDKYYVRGGYSYYGKAFKASEVNKDLFYQGVSFGLGMRQQNFYVDMAYSVLFGTSKYYMYNDPPYLVPATLSSSKSAFTITMGFKF
jgi:hypothetical protein